MFAKSLVLSIVSSVLLFSCAPKDEKLVRPPAPPKVDTQAAEDVLKSTYFAFDKQVEALHYLKASLNPDYAAAKGLTSETVTDTDVLVVRKLSAVSLKSEIKDYVQTTSQTFMLVTIILSAENSTVLSVVMTNEGKNSLSTLHAIKDGKQLPDAAIALNNVVKNITILPTLNAGEFTVSTESLDEIKTVNSKTKEVYEDILKNKIVSNFVWNGEESTLNDKIELTSVTIDHTKHAKEKVQTNLKSQASTLVLNLVANCVSLNGSLELLNAKPKAGAVSETLKLTFEDSTLIKNGKKAKDAITCASRPVIDLRKLQ